MDIISVVGNRPQFIKLAAIHKQLTEHTHTIIHSGQHYDYGMSGTFFKELSIPAPNYNLNVGSASHATQTGQIMKNIEPILSDIKSDVILVYGDTNTTLAAALTARKLGKTVAHVEAGCRTYEKNMPEEINRVMVSHLSDIHFCPTQRTVENLTRENIWKQVYQVGDVMYDTLKQHAEKIKPPEYTDYVVATIHRAENTDNTENLSNILHELNKYGENKTVIFPLHPRTSHAIFETRCGKIPKDIKFVQPVGYIDMLSLIKHADAVITDSGGVQKEAFLLHTPCITVRKTTEWPETQYCGWNTLSAPDKIFATLNTIKKPSIKMCDMFGHGDTSEKIVNILVES